GYESRLDCGGHRWCHSVERTQPATRGEAVQIGRVGPEQGRRQTDDVENQRGVHHSTSAFISAFMQFGKNPLPVWVMASSFEPTSAHRAAGQSPPFRPARRTCCELEGAELYYASATNPGNPGAAEALLQRNEHGRPTHV